VGLGSGDGAINVIQFPFHRSCLIGGVAADLSDNQQPPHGARQHLTTTARVWRLRGSVVEPFSTALTSCRSVRLPLIGAQQRLHRLGTEPYAEAQSRY